MKPDLELELAILELLHHIDVHYGGTDAPILTLANNVQLFMPGEVAR